MSKKVFSLKNINNIFQFGPYVLGRNSKYSTASVGSPREKRIFRLEALVSFLTKIQQASVEGYALVTDTAAYLEFPDGQRGLFTADGTLAYCGEKGLTAYFLFYAGNDEDEEFVENLQAAKEAFSLCDDDEEDSEAILSCAIAGNNLYYRARYKKGDTEIEFPKFFVECSEDELAQAVAEAGLSMGMDASIEYGTSKVLPSSTASGTKKIGAMDIAELVSMFRLPSISTTGLDWSKPMEWPASLQPFIPNPNGFKYTPKIISLTRMLFKSIVQGRPINVGLYGPSASGKSYGFKAAAALMGMPYMSMELSNGTMESDLRQEWIPNANKGIDGDERDFVCKDSPLITAVKYGCLCELQEVNFVSSAAVLGSLNMLCNSDERRITDLQGNTLTAHPLFVLGISFNPGYTGTHQLSESLLSRFTCLPMEELTASEMTEIAEMHTSLSKKTVAEMANILVQFRSVSETEGIQLQAPVNLRQLLSWCKATEFDEELEAQMKLRKVEGFQGPNSPEGDLERMNRAVIGIISSLSHEREEQDMLFEVWKSSPNYRKKYACWYS
jgi:MoxR-like ATPase